DEAAASLDDDGGGRLDTQLDDGRAGGNRPLGGVEVVDDGVHLHVTCALSSRDSGSSATSASYRQTWNEPGPFASSAASSPATPNATSAATAASNGSSTARKQPVIALDM